jgi:hypothetical protein
MTSTEELIYNVSCQCSGLLWSLCYILLIRRSALDRAHAMPLAPLCVNLSWEFIFGFLYPDAPPMNWINMIWCCVDVIIVWQYLRYARQEWPKNLPQACFAPFFVLCLVIAFFGVLTLTLDWKDWHGTYTGWGDELLICITMVSLLVRRGSVRGQSLYIALTRFFGSLVLIPGQYIQEPGSRFLIFIYAAFIVFDLIYICLYCRQARLEGINPWKRL